MARFFVKKPSRISSLFKGDALHIPGFKVKLKEYFLRDRWEELVGDKLSKKTEIDKLINKTLYIKVDSSPWLTELTYQKDALINQINSLMGQNIVKEMRFFVGKIQKVKRVKNKTKEVKAKPQRKLENSEIKSIKSATDKIKDDDLKKLIEKTMSIGKGKGKF